MKDQHSNLLNTLTTPRRTLIALALSAQMLAPMSALAANFTDTQGHWAQANIQKLSSQQVIGGYPDGTFRPEGLVNRAEFAAILVKALKLPTQGTTGPASFVDVAASNWAFPAVEAVRANNLVSGYPGGYFYPAQSIKRAEAMAILANAARLPKPDEARTNQILAPYSDADQLPTWARSAAAAALEAGIFVNHPSPNMLRPNAPASRAEVAVLTDRLDTYMIARSQPPASQPVPQTAQQTAMPGQPPAQGMPPAQAQSAQAGMTQGNPNMLQGRISVIPAETRFSGTLTTPVSSQINKVGDHVTLNVDRPLVSQDNVVIVPNGSRIRGAVTLVEPAGRAGKNAKMAIAFEEIITPDGRRIPIQASIATEDKLLEGGTTKGRVGRAVGTTAIGAGLGAALGTAMGPLSGGKVGRGAVYGTAVGAGVGALGAAVQKGQEVVVTTGDQLEIKLEQPIQMEAGQ